MDLSEAFVQPCDLLLYTGCERMGRLCYKCGCLGVDISMMDMCDATDTTRYDR